MTCTACLSAETSPRADRWENGCTSCIARATAATGATSAEQPGKPVSKELKMIARSLFGDQWKEGLAEILRWGHLIRATAAQAVNRPRVGKE